MKTIMIWISHGISVCIILYMMILWIPSSYIPASLSMIYRWKEMLLPFQYVVYVLACVWIIGYCIYMIRKRKEHKHKDFMHTSYINQVYVSEHQMQMEEDCMLIQGKVHNAKKVLVTYVVVYMQFFDRKGVMIDADEYYVIGREGLASGSTCEFSYRYYKKLNIVSCKVSIIRYKEQKIKK